MDRHRVLSIASVRGGKNSNDTPMPSIPEKRSARALSRSGTAAGSRSRSVISFAVDLSRFLPGL